MRASIVFSIIPLLCFVLPLVRDIKLFWEPFRCTSSAPAVYVRLPVNQKLCLEVQYPNGGVIKRIRSPRVVMNVKYIHKGQTYVL